MKCANGSPAAWATASASSGSACSLLASVGLAAGGVGRRPGRPRLARRPVTPTPTDPRGIDVAFLYEATMLTPGEVFFHVVMRRNATRDIVQVDFTTAADTRLVAFGSHWPSRSGRQYESAGYRHIAGETLAYFHERALDVLGRRSSWATSTTNRSTPR
jgi:hypothetical protein